MSFVRRQGIVLESSHGAVVTFVDEVAGERIRGNWWSHPRAHQIFALTRGVRGSRDVLVCRLVDNKITYVHRRLWPALVRLASDLGHDRLTAIREIHTSQGKHVVKTRMFPAWVPLSVRKAGKRLTVVAARAALASSGMAV